MGSRGPVEVYAVTLGSRGPDKVYTATLGSRGPDKVCDEDEQKSTRATMSTSLSEPSDVQRVQSHL
jgi:hypothetical protein